jgi:hypothetical protein
MKVKNVKFFLWLINYTSRHENRCGSADIALLLFISALDGDEWLASRPDRFTSEGKAPGTHCIGFWVGHRADLDAEEKRRIEHGHPANSPPLYRLSYPAHLI